MTPYLQRSDVGPSLNLPQPQINPGKRICNSIFDRKLEALDDRIITDEGQPRTKLLARQTDALQKNQNSIVAIKKRMESKLEDFWDNHRQSLESNQIFFLDRIKKSQEDFDQRLQAQA